MNADRNAAVEFEGVMAQAALVQYQPRAVVSRTIIKKGGGSVTAFAFDAGQALSEHTTPIEALALIMYGEAEVSVADTLYRARTGHLVRLPGGQPHAVKALTRLKMILIMLRV
jgi:quercetin dioxygenase-like cupin family protein